MLVNLNHFRTTLQKSKTTRLSYISAVVAAVLFGSNLFLTFVADLSDARSLVLDILRVSECFLTALLLRHAAVISKPTSARQYRAWNLFAIALLTYGIGNGVLLVFHAYAGDEPFFSVADIFYFAYYPLMMIGLEMLPSRPLERWERRKLVVDMAIVAVASLLIFWVVLFGPIIATIPADTSWIDIVVNLLYPTLDLMLLWGLCALIFRQHHFSLTSPLAFLALGVILMTICDVVFDLQSIQGDYISDGLIDFIYSTSTYCLLIAGIRYVQQLGGSSGNSSEHGFTLITFGKTKGRLKPAHLLPYFWTGLAYLILIKTAVLNVETFHVLFWISAVGVALTIFFVVIRHVMTILENLELSSQLSNELQERRQTEVELRASNERAAELVRVANEASEAKSNFLASMSHEIRTPMNGVIGFTNLLLDTPLTSDQQEYVQTIRQSGDSLLMLINDLLDYSKIEAGKLELEPAPFDLRACCADVIDLITAQAMGKGLEIALLAGPAPISVYADIGRVRQVLLNLLGNAVKFTEKGYIQVSLKILNPESPNPNTVQISVRDTGIGIQEEKLGLLFQRFSQADVSTTRKYGGTGLGLAICKQLVELMNGRIAVKSEYGVGSTFRFTLPLTDPPQRLENAQGTMLNAEQLRILAVDDLEMNRKLIRCLLSGWNFNFSLASDARDALTQLNQAVDEKQPFDVVITDHLMPGMNGEELTQCILNDPRLNQTKVILFSSAANRGDSSHFRALGFSSVLSKPITRPSLLLDAIVNCRGDYFESAEVLLPNMTLQMSKSTLPTNSQVRGRILLAEDNSVNQKLAVRMLENLGYRVDVVANGVEAVQMAKRITYDLIFMDCLMPEMDGFQATELIRMNEVDETATLRQTKAHVPIVALTANAMDGDRERCLQAGMDDFVSKPIKPRLLEIVLEKWLSVRAETAQPQMPLAS